MASLSLPMPGQALDLIMPLYGLSREAGEDDATVRNRITLALASKGAGSIDAVEAAANEYINNGFGVADPLIIPRLYAVAYNADPELAKTFAVTDIYGNAQGESEYTRDEITCSWNGKISILASDGLTITYMD